MTYGKVVGESLKVAPTTLRINGKLIASPRGSDYKKAGYMPIDSTDRTPEGYRWNNKWEIVDGKIVKKYDPIPQEEIEAMSAMVVLSGDEAEAYQNMEQTIADAQAATQEAQTAAHTAQQEAAAATAAKEAAEAAQARAEADLANVDDIVQKIEEVFG